MIINSIKSGLTTARKNFHLVIVYWLVNISLLLAFTVPFAIALNHFSVNSNIFSKMESKPELENLFLADFLMHSRAELLNWANPITVIIILAIISLLNTFLTGGILARFKACNLQRSKKEARHSENESGFITSAATFFPQLFAVSLITWVSLILLNVLTTQLSAMLDVFAWETFKSESLRYYLSFFAVRLLYLVCYFYLALYFQFLRIALVDGNTERENSGLIEKLKTGIRLTGDFLHKSKWKAIGLYGAILMLMALVYCGGNLFFYSFSSTKSGTIQLIWVLMMGLTFIFLRFLSYASCLELYSENCRPNLRSQNN